MILAKCCHDTDLLQWLVGVPCKKVQSFGSLSHFNAKNAPEGAPDRCTDGCPHADTCYYNAIKLYYGKEAAGFMVNACGVKPEQVRLSIGIENIEDILADLDQALRA